VLPMIPSRVVLLILACACATPSGSPGNRDTGPGRPCGNKKERSEAAAVSPDTVLEAGSPLARVVTLAGIRYPDNLRVALIEGSARATFVFDTAGRVIPGTVRITSETHREFGDAVCRFLRQARYQRVHSQTRAMVVRVLEVPFNFTLTY
jgi:outer membrane biosynthesis protein TonB